MSTLSSKILSLLSDALDVIAPKVCPVCRQNLSKGQRYVCTSCRLDIPLTGYWLKSDNPMAERVRALRPQIGEAAALFYYIHNSGWRTLIHDMKYADMWYHAHFFGDWLGRELSESELYEDIDMVVAVPLHFWRQMCRGYNQSDYIAHSVAKRMNIPHEKGAIKRVRYNLAQAKTARHERWNNVEGLFKVTKPELFENRSVLLIDDVFTTGATIMSCAEAILAVAPSCRLSIATVAVSHHEFGNK